MGRGLPLSTDGMAMDARQFFERNQLTEREVRQEREKEHSERAKTAPSSEPQVFKVGDLVRVERPRPLGTHLTQTWFTPGEVVRRLGQDAYRVKVGPGRYREHHWTRAPSLVHPGTNHGSCYHC